MPITVKMPQLGESVTEGTIGNWLVEPGQEVRQFDSLVEVITDKVTAEVPSPAAGRVGELLAAEGQRLSVGDPLCTLEGDAGLEPVAPVEPEAAASSPAKGGATTAPTVVAAGDPGPPTAPPRAGVDAPSGFISPAVRSLADEHGVDLGAVRGTGFQGRITKRDLLLFIESGPAGRAPVPEAPLRPAAGDSGPRPGQRVELSPMRRSIAEHMVRSRHTAPHAWTMVEIDMSGVAAAREAHRAEFRRATGVDLSFLPFAMKATCLALRAVPTMNATFEEDSILLLPEINLGLAVAVPEGLLVPVVRAADQYSVAGLARAASSLIERARAGKATLEDVSGGTFTLNNAGALGTVMSQAIINSPEAGILVMDAVVRRPVAVGDAIAIRPMMNLCLSFDHRVNDGAAAARFLSAVKSSLEAVTGQTELF